MSHILEQYAKCCGVKIGKPTLNKHFYPINCDKFISIDIDSDNFSENYPHWDITLHIIKQELLDQGVKILQLGGEKSKKLRSSDLFLNKISYKNRAYIISKSILHIGLNNLSSHIASCYNKKTLTISGNSYQNCTKPYWSDKENLKLISPNFSKEKPILSKRNNSNRIKEIKPEEIADSVFELLKLKKKSNFKSLSFGGSYNMSVLEFVPNCDFSYNIPFNNINVRMDKFYDADKLASLIENKSVEITTSDPIPDHLLIKNKIKCINYISDDFESNFLEKVSNMGIKLVLLCSAKDKLQKQRFKFFDYKIHDFSKEEIIEENKKDIEDVNWSKLKTFSSRKIFSKNKIYNSYYEESKNKDDLFLDLDWLMCYYHEHEQR
mgnify:CR=1 FL=1|jgi:hypothetical protein